MTFHRLVLPALSLLGATQMSCAPPPASTGGAEIRAASPSQHGPDARWMSTVRTRIAAEGRAITARDGAFEADLPELGLLARFDGNGVAIRGDAGTTLAIHTVAWGRGGDLRPVSARQPAPGACTSEIDARGRCIRRLEYPLDGGTEWWTGLGTGLEQGWTLSSAPAGAGPLVLAVAVDGARPRDTGDGSVALTDSSGRTWRVSAVNARDARGRALPARAIASPDGLRVEVEDAGARFPLTIDPVYTTAAWTASMEDVGFGDAVAGAGDVNGDGYDDVIVGVWAWRASTGRAYVYLGSADGLSVTATSTLEGEDIGSSFGEAVAGAGDVNGDGYDDVIVGAYGSDRAQVFLGAASGVSETAATTLAGDSDSLFGWSVASAGDVNGDGYCDVLVGAYGYGAATGRVTLYLGAASGLGASAATTLDGEASPDGFGFSVSSAGDVNGDGYDDIIVGASNHSLIGRAYVYHGSASGLSATAAATLDGTVSEGGFGNSVGAAGDVNGDGYDDVIVGADAVNRETGQASVFYGSASGVSTTAAAMLTGESTLSWFGYAVAGAGDLDGDGYDDIVVGAYGYSGSMGRAYVYLGSASGVATTATTALTGERVNDYLGTSVSAAGDIDGDGYADLIVGTNREMACVYAGASGGVASSATTTLTGRQNEAFGYSVSGAGDINGDGYDDLLVGEPEYGSGTGRAYLYLGSADGPAWDAATTLTGASPSDDFGRSVSGAGDVNGDGYDDVLVGADGVDASRGRAYLYLGSADGLFEAAATTMDGASTGDQLGLPVSGAGDVNGDGYDDVLVGATGASGSAERIYLYLGSAGGLSDSAATTLDGTGAGGALGSSATGAGDVNGDGYDDVIVGAPEDGGGLGSAYLYEGAATGLSTTPSTTLDGVARLGYFGSAVSGAGDVNGDGYDDVIVGAWSEPAAYVYYGSADGIDASGATRMGGGDEDNFGQSVSGAGDVNGDGYDDVVVGAPGERDFRGAVYLYEGTASGLYAVYVAGMYGPSDYIWYGASVAGAGDVNGDGYDDVLVGQEEDGARCYLGYADTAIDPTDTGDAPADTADSGDTAASEDTEDSAETAASGDRGDSADAADTGGSRDTSDATPSPAKDPTASCGGCASGGAGGRSSGGGALLLLAVVSLRISRKSARSSGKGTGIGSAGG